jgi:hypothetical protein
VAAGGRSDRGKFGDDSMGEEFPMLRVADVRAFMIEGGHRGDHGGHHCHRMSVAMEAPQHLHQLLIHRAMPHDGVAKQIELRAHRELPVNQQMGNFQEARALGELLDGVAAIQKQPRFAVDIGYLAFGARGRDESWIEGEYAEILGQMRNIQHVRSNGSRNGLEQRGFSGGEVFEFVFLTHNDSPSMGCRVELLLFRAAGESRDG